MASILKSSLFAVIELRDKFMFFFYESRLDYLQYKVMTYGLKVLVSQNYTKQLLEKSQLLIFHLQAINSKAVFVPTIMKCEPHDITSRAQFE